MFNQANFPQVANGRSASGEMGVNEVQELQKALSAGYGTDPGTLTGGAAMRIQSLEKTMLSTIQENKHFRLFNALANSNATATIDEWTEQSGVGGRLGGSTNSETGNIGAATGQYNRRVGQVKYLMTRREVSFVLSLQNAIVEAEASEQSNGALQLLTDAEFLCFEGDSAVVPTEFDGITAQIVSGVAAGQIDGNHVLDCRAASLQSVNLVNKAASIISGFGNFGTPTHLFMSQATQADFDTGLDPAFRVPLTNVPNGGISIGAPVVGIRTSWGDIATMPDVFIRDQDQLQPYEVANSADAIANVALKPTSVTVDASVSDTASLFGGTEAGNYYWAVTGVNASGESAGTFTTQTSVASGKKATLTITSAGGTETGYIIYRSRKNGTNAAADMRLMARVAKAGATTTYVDKNLDIPGTTKAYIMNLTPGAQAITWRQMLPMMKFPLYPTVSATIPWAQLLFGYLRIGKRKHHVVIKNILPTSSTWLPFA